MFSKKAQQLILSEEGIDQPWKWPGVDSNDASGVTIGVGYDLGYVDRESFEKTWKDVLEPTTYAKLQGVIGLKGAKAKAACSTLHDCLIPAATSIKVFVERVLPDYVQQTRHAFPGFDSLPEDVQGVLVSLVYNRGTSMDGDRRKEMKLIQFYVSSYSDPRSNKQIMLHYIANAIRAMKRLWPEGSGLIKRREHEAKLVEESIQYA